MEWYAYTNDNNNNKKRRGKNREEFENHRKDKNIFQLDFIVDYNHP